jgi:hypothetical protein
MRETQIRTLCYSALPGHGGQTAIAQGSPATAPECGWSHVRMGKDQRGFADCHSASTKEDHRSEITTSLLLSHIECSAKRAGSAPRYGGLVLGRRPQCPKELSDRYLQQALPPTPMRLFLQTQAGLTLPARCPPGGGPYPRGGRMESPRSLAARFPMELPPHGGPCPRARP